MYKGEHRKQAGGKHAASHNRLRPFLVTTLVIALAMPPVVLSSALAGTQTAQASGALTARLTASRSFHLYYTVHSGDTLSRLAAYFCHNPARYPSIARASGIRNPNRIYVGERLTINCAYSGRSFARGSSRAHVGYHTHYGYSGLKALWREAGGPSWAAPRAERIALCESGGYIYAHNPSGASGLWQILGNPFPGNPYNPYTNARMAVAKFRGAGGSFAPWVCRG